MASTAPKIAAMRRNIGLYPWYAGLFNAFFWMPVFFLYFGKHLTLGEVLGLEAVYYGAVVVLEVPSGYFSDAVGRRTTLLVSAVCLVSAYVLFFVGDSFSAFATAQVVLAGGIAFNSGTDTSFHYDSLASLDRAEEYEDREAIAARNALFATGVAALAGGAIAAVELRFAYGLSAVFAAATLVLVLFFREPLAHEASADVTGEATDDETSDETGASEALGFGPQLLACLAYLKQPALAWLFALAVLMTVLNHIPYEFYQPYLELVGGDIDWLDQTPLATGAHMFAATMLAAWVAARSATIDARLGKGPTLLLAAGIQTAIIATMALVLHPLVAVLLLLRGVPGAMFKAPLLAAVTPRISLGQRATYLSVQSLAGRLGFALFLGGLSYVAGAATIDDWTTLSHLLWLGAAVGVVGVVVLAVALVRVELER
ncbi:MAG: MFS transporter [Persicimonas sp.]